MKKPMINYAKREEKDDELYTPEFVVLPVLEFLKKDRLYDAHSMMKVVIL